MHEYHCAQYRIQYSSDNLPSYSPDSHHQPVLRTQLLYNLPLIINDTFLLVSNSADCLNLFHPIRILVFTAASASPSTLNMSPKNKTYLLTSFLHWHPISTLVRPVPITGFTQPLQTNIFITSYMLPFILLHFLCTHYWQLVHCIKLLPTNRTQCNYNKLITCTVQSM